MPKAQKQILWELEHKCRTIVKATTYYTIIEHAIYTITSQTRNLKETRGQERQELSVKAWVFDASAITQ
jgi:hypothetical protein